MKTPKEPLLEEVERVKRDEDGTLSIEGRKVEKVGELNEGEKKLSDEWDALKEEALGLSKEIDRVHNKMETKKKLMWGNIEDRLGEHDRSLMLAGEGVYAVLDGEEDNCNCEACQARRKLEKLLGRKL